MATLEWSDALALDVPAMDSTHQEFVALLAQAEVAGDAQLGALWGTLMAHTESHFGQEDRWMQATGFSAENCHTTQHKVVLEIMHEAAKHYASGDLGRVREMLPELANWFSYHAQTMDAALAQHMRNVGFDPESGLIAHAQALPHAAISGCGGACSQPQDPAQQAAASPSVAAAQMQRGECLVQWN